MNLIELFKRIKPYVYPYRWLVIVTLILTLIGSLMAQVNAIVLDRTVDAINALVNPEGFAWSKAARILTILRREDAHQCIQGPLSGSHRPHADLQDGILFGKGQ